MNAPKLLLRAYTGYCGFKHTRRELRVMVSADDTDFVTYLTPAQARKLAAELLSTAANVEKGVYVP